MRDSCGLRGCTSSYSGSHRVSTPCHASTRIASCQFFQPKKKKTYICYTYNIFKMVSNLILSPTNICMIHAGCVDAPRVIVVVAMYRPRVTRVRETRVVDFSSQKKKKKHTYVTHITYLKPTHGIRPHLIKKKTISDTFGPTTN
jgi:hypothetical protein